MGKRILVVEDDPDMRLLTTSILKSRGFDVTAVETGCEAMAALKQGLFDLAVLDVLLPDTNGLALCDQIKKQNFMIFMPVILLTSVTDEAIIRQSFKMGADEYLQKPPAPVDFIGRVQVLLQKAGQSATAPRQAKATGFA